MIGNHDQASFAAAARHRLAGAVAALWAALLATACHTYSPVTVSDVTPGDRVRTLLTQAQYEEFDEYLLGGDRVMEGTVVEADA